MFLARLRYAVAPALAASVLLVAPARPVQAQDKKKINTDEMVEKGLDYLKRSQNPDGHWDAGGGQYPTVMTALAGMALLMEGSTLREGKYSDNLVKAVDWFLVRSQNNGLLGNPQNPTESSRYIYGHGFGLMFLSCAYGEEEDDKDRRKKLEKVIQKAVEFSGKAQTKQGGWGYVSGGRRRRASTRGPPPSRNCKASAPPATPASPCRRAIIDNATEYLRKCTTPRGGVIYNLGPGGADRPGRRRSGRRSPPPPCACAFSSAATTTTSTPSCGLSTARTAIYGNGGRAGAQGGHDDYQTLLFRPGRSTRHRRGPLRQDVPGRQAGDAE